jgi:NAD(P)-dependent dehydrogenase (short-subunit alcohol dehydrogenase family)
MLYDFRGQVAVVTGGASGIGEGCARRIAQDGATVIVADIDLKKAEAVAKSIGGHALHADVSDAASVEKLAADVEKQFGPVSIVVTSAGILQPALPPDELPLETWDRVVDINFRGTYLTCVAFGKRMQARGKGSIVTIASITATLSAPLHAYGPTKAAIAMLTKTLATEWGRSGVRINAISPGATLTGAVEEAVRKGERDLSKLANIAPIGRMLTPLEIGNAAAFLCSDQATAITGIDLVVDGGWIASGAWHAYAGIRPKREPQKS